jgi:hypothetical protein
LLHSSVAVKVVYMSHKLPNRSLTSRRLINAFSFTVVVGLSCAASATPLSRYLPAGAVATLELQNLRPAYNISKPLIKDFASYIQKMSGADVLPMSMVDTTLEPFWGSFGNESSIGAYTVGENDVQMLAVTRVNAPTALLLNTQMKMQMEMQYNRSKPVKVGAFSFQKAGEMYLGQGGGVAYASSNYDLMVAFLKRLNGQKLPVLASNPVYQNTMSRLEGNQFKIYANLSLLVKFARINLTKIFLPRVLDPFLEGLNTLGQSGFGLNVVADGFEGQAVLNLNRDGKDKDLYNATLASKAEFSSAQHIPADAYAVQTCAIDPKAETRSWAKWLTRFDLYDVTGILTDSDLVNTVLDSSEWLGTEASTVSMGITPDQNLNDMSASFKNSITLYQVDDEAAADAAMSSFTQNYNAALKHTLEFYRKSADGIIRMSEVANSERASIANLLGLLNGTYNLGYRIKDGYLYLGEEAKLDAFVNAPKKLSELASYQALPKGGHCLDLTPSSVKYSKDQYRNLLKQSMGTNAMMMDAGMMDGLTDYVYKFTQRITGSSGSYTVEGNQVIGKGKMLVTFK